MRLLAQDAPGLGGGGGGRINLENPLKANSVLELINAILDIIVQIGLPIIVLAIVYVGFLFVKARGNENELKEAKQAFLWTVIGAGIVLGAKVISTAIDLTIKNL